MKVIKKPNKQLHDGDIFILSPFEDVYFYGKIFKANINNISNDIFINGKHLVFIFKCHSDKQNIDKYVPDYENLLIPPTIVDTSYWSKGLFFNLGNEIISDHELTLDYGFLNIGIKSNHFCKEDGTKISKEPHILGIYGTSTITGVASKIRKELIMNSSILDN